MLFSSCGRSLFKFLLFIPSKGCNKILRIPISFTTCTGKSVFRHIVLGIRNQRKWGAMGISRLPNLMYKPVTYDSLNALIGEFISSYGSYHHVVERIDLGLPFSHDCVSDTPFQWKIMNLTLGEDKRGWDDHHDAFLQYSRDCSSIFDCYDKTGNMPKWFTLQYRNGHVTLKSRR